MVSGNGPCRTGPYVYHTKTLCTSLYSPSPRQQLKTSAKEDPGTSFFPLLMPSSHQDGVQKTTRSLYVYAVFRTPSRAFTVVTGQHVLRNPLRTCAKVPFYGTHPCEARKASNTYCQTMPYNRICWFKFQIQSGLRQYDYSNAALLDSSQAIERDITS